MELEDDQRLMLRTASKQIRRASALLRSVNPEGFQAAEYAKRICDQAWGSRADEPAIEDVINGLAGIIRYCPTLGAGTQETIQNALEYLVERMGLTGEVKRALEARQVITTGRSR